MTTKKTKSKKAGRTPKGERTAVLIRFNPEVLKGLDQYRALTTEDRGPLVQRMVMEALIGKGYYPPKPE